jgi:hypothetical protein
MQHPGGRSKRFASAVAVGAFALGVPLVAGPLSATAAAGASARPARTLSLNESGRLHLLSKHGFTLYEQGPGSGTVSATVYVRLEIVSTSHVNAEVKISPHGGTIAGTASASYHRGSSSASFAGSLTITHGSGSYANAHGSGLSFSGTIQKSNDAISVSVRGNVSE